MVKINITRTKNLDLCTSCEICSAVCLEDAIIMEYKSGQFLPKVDDKKCIECGLCLELCPGIDIGTLGVKNRNISNDVFDNFYLECYTAYSKNLEIRKNSTSGGLLTSLIVELIKNKEFDKAFVLNFDKFNGKPVRLKATSDINEIVNAAKSKYIPASIYEIIRTLQRYNGKKYIIVGTPCQIKGIKNYIQKKNIGEKNLLFLGLFCDSTLNFNFIKYMENLYSKDDEKLTKLEYRTKEKFGWPGHCKVYFDSGREKIIDRRFRMQLKKYFQLNRCLFCFDKLNRLADISFGDCYIGEKSSLNGKSNVIVRTKKGSEIFNKYLYLFSLEEESIEKIRDSQYLQKKIDNLEYAKILIQKNNLCSGTILDYKINNKISRRLSKLQKWIKWGGEYNIKKIIFSLLISKIAGKLRTIEQIMLGGIILGSTIVKDLFILSWSRKIVNPKKNKQNIIIIRGTLFNKGSQAMTFTVVDQIKRRFPNKNVYLFSTQDFERDEKEKKKYAFNILPWDFIIKIEILSIYGKLLKGNNRFSSLEDSIREVIKNTDFFIDISGYALSSQLGPHPINYLLDIMIAKKYSIPYYIFPQSLGPFDFPQKYKIFSYILLKLYLPYPKKIFPRELEGVTCVRKFTKNNIEKRFDIVLENKEVYNLNNIYSKSISFRYIKIRSSSVCIIPNLRVVERTQQNEIYSIYKLLINRLIKAKITVYILRHSYEDLEICEKIKNMFLDNKNIQLISYDLNAIELENVIKQFDFIITSRYHSIIHAYKNGVPVILIGWATKYFELLKEFDQLDYFFDCRKKIDIGSIKYSLEKMVQEYQCEREKIIGKIITLKQTTVNIFDSMER